MYVFWITVLVAKEYSLYWITILRPYRIYRKYLQKIPIFGEIVFSLETFEINSEWYGKIRIALEIFSVDRTHASVNTTMFR